jgi:hypothetical protein
MADQDIFNKLQPNPHNPRFIGEVEFERLCKSIKNFPTMLEKRPIVYDENFIVIGGNMRLKALQKLVSEGFEIKDSYFVKAEGWTEQQKKEFVIRDNVSDGKWDYEMLANEWTDLPVDDWGLNISGLLDGQDESKLWEGMPDVGDSQGFNTHKTLMVHFENQESVDTFSKLVDQEITANTKYIWYPFKAKEDMKGTAFVTEHES